ncbi:MAG: peptide chain release factor N(5)-glutamine methyltransferase [Salinarimonadaceae bacterium]|nr:MAG: peptide chain release factor N(5)-glutamine methyltransferase [Salinarimonadaceae bacterium]
MRSVRDALREAGADDPALDARILTLEAAGLDATAFARDPDAPLSAQAAARIADWTARRAAGEPVWRILGAREFRGLRFALSPATLEPRPDTETLVELALAEPAAGPEARVLDLGTGTGCILLALLHELPDARGLGVDRSSEAAATARANARALGLADRAAFVVGDWGAALAGTFDLVVSNPPYIPDGDIDGLGREVREHDPRLALAGGADGLEAYRTILAQAPGLLAPGGALVVEYGVGQGESIRALAEAFGLERAGSARDLGGVERAASFRPAPDRRFATRE